MSNISPATKNLNLTRFAKEAKSFDSKFTETLREEGTRQLNLVQELLILDHSSDLEKNKSAVKELLDLRSAMMVVQQRVDSQSKVNYEKVQEFTESLRPGDGRLKEAEQEQRAPEGGYDSVTREWEAERAFLPHTGSKRQASGLWGIGKFITDLTKLISLSAASATMPPGPIALSVSSAAREETAMEPEGSERRENDQALSYYSEDGKFRGAVVNGSRPTTSCSRVETDARMFAMVDDLKLRLEQTTVNQATDIAVERFRNFADYGRKDRFLLSDKVEFIRNTLNVNQGVISTFPHHVAHPQIPESGMDEYF